MAAPFPAQMDATPSTLLTLLKNRRFLPLFVCQFWSAFADNIFRSALVVMATYDPAFSGGFAPGVMATVIGLIFILPFFIFSSFAGQLADKYEKSRLVQIIKGVEILILLYAAWGFYTHSLKTLLVTLFLSATQSTFFGPLKYSLLPVYLKDEELVAGNGLVEGSTFLAILFGTLFGGTLMAFHGQEALTINAFMLLSTFVGWIASFYLLKAPSDSSRVKLNFNLIQETVHIIRQGVRDRVIFLTIIGISWFWLVGAVFLAQITPYGRVVINGNENVASLFLVIFTLGIGLGSIACNRLMKGKIDARLVPWSALGITIFVVDFVIASNQIHIISPDYIGVGQFLSHGIAWRICFDLLMIAFSGGIYTVPLYALLQKQAHPGECSRMIAVNNIINAFFMVLSSAISIILLSLSVSILTIFLIVGIVNIYIVIRMSRLVPESILQLILQALFRLFFKVEVKGLENLSAAGKRVLIIANHTSFLDAILIFTFIPEKLSFAIYTFYVERWWIQIISSGINLFPVNPTNPMATKTLIEHLRRNNKCVIFPEGRITETGSLMKIFDGPGMIADKANAVILPIRIDGAQYTLFSRLKGRLRRKFFPKIRITILPPYCLVAPPTLIGRERRKVLSSQIYSMMTDMLFETSLHKTSVFGALIDAGKLYGMRTEIVEDMNRDPNSYRKLIARSFILGHYLTSLTAPRENVGILLPTSIGALVSFLGLQSVGRVPAMLNFSLGSRALMECAQLARLRLILTSHRFIATARLEPLMAELEKHFQLIYLEDVVKKTPLRSKLKGLLFSHIPRLAYRCVEQSILDEDVAVILFTSGSEGKPKGVALTHRNLNTNRNQVASIVDFTPQDVVLNVLPLFHSFGLTAGTLLPLLMGVRTFLYPSPLHYRIIPVIAYDINASIFFATDTFLNRYARVAHPYDFYAIRYVFAGAEKLKEETRQLWSNKFGLNIFEGYGTTEASPVLSVNTRMYNRAGTVGRFIPAIQYQLEKVDGLVEGGRLHVKGPNIMRGYLGFETGDVSPVSSMWGAGWYDTGDIVTVNEEGFVTILGRAKRFAKIGGEMISLVAIEDSMYSAFPEHNHALFAFPDDKKGEQLVLLTTANLTREDVLQTLKTAGSSEVMFPRRIFTIKDIPILATGKVDLQSAKIIADEKMKEV